MARVHEEASRAPNQAVESARWTASKSVFFGEDFVASVALIAHYESETSAAVASVLIRAREPFDEAVKLAALVKLTNVVGAADVYAADEDAWQSEAAAAENGVKFVAEAVIDGDVALVDGDAEATEDGSDSSAVVESAADDAEAGEVYDDSLVKAGRKSSGDGSARGTPGAKYGGGDPDAAEERRRFGSGGAGFGLFLEEALNVFER